MPFTYVYAADDSYAVILAAYTREGGPRIVEVANVAYQSHAHPTLGLYFITIPADDENFLDPADPSGRWHNVYGYTPEESDE